MKKLMLITLLVVGWCATMTAQTKVNIQDNEARVLDVTANAFVKPLAVELKIDETRGRISESVEIKLQRLPTEFKKNDLENLHNYAAYVVSQRVKCDVIVAPTYNIVNNSTNDGLIITVTGFAANYINWHTATLQDMELIRLAPQRVNVVSDPERRK